MPYYFRIIHVRPGEFDRELGTVPDAKAADEWFTGAYAMGLLPDPPSYHDELQIWEVWEIPDAPAKRVESRLRWIWRLTWHQFESQPSLAVVAK